MTDRELLELAAKAAGYDVTHRWNAERLELFPPVISLCIPGISTAWNPLDFDGDALRLAVKLSIEIYIDEGTSTTCDESNRFGSSGFSGAYEKHVPGDHAQQCAATRRAIVRAAAEIGRAMV